MSATAAAADRNWLGLSANQNIGLYTNTSNQNEQLQIIQKTHIDCKLVYVFVIDKKPTTN